MNTVEYRPTAVDRAAGFVNVTIPSWLNDGYVRVEALYDTGSPNTITDPATGITSSAIGTNRQWDFGAFTSPIFVNGNGPSELKVAPPGNSNASAQSKQALSVLPAAQAPGVASSVTLAVENIYGTPVAGASVTLRSVDSTGQLGSSYPTVTSDASGVAVLSVPDGDYVPAVTKAGCVIPSLEPIAAPDPERYTVILDCLIPDDSRPVAAIVNGPGTDTNLGIATFSWTATDNLPGVITYCGLDDLDMDEFAWTPCDGNQATFRDLPTGRHVFSVFARDPSGLVSPVVTRTFFVRQSPDARPCTICVLDSTGTVISITGNAAITVKQGNLAFGSSATSAIAATGNATVVLGDGSIKGPGGIRKVGNATIPAVVTSPAATNPRRDIVPAQVPAAGTRTCVVGAVTSNCGLTTTYADGQVVLADGDFKSIAATGPAVVSVGPGRIDNLTINGATVKLRPGVYFIGSITLN